MKKKLGRGRSLKNVKIVQNRVHTLYNCSSICFSIVFAFSCFVANVQISFGKQLFSFGSKGGGVGSEKGCFGPKEGVVQARKKSAPLLVLLSILGAPERVP